MGMESCGVKDLMLFSVGASAALKPLRTASVVAMTRVSGPAAATSPLVEEMLKSEAVGGGSFSDGHGEGSSRSFVSPAIVRKPSFCWPC